MDDHAFYDACAIAAMQELIRKNPHADSLKGADVENIRLEIAKSADDYAALMVMVRRGRRMGVPPRDPLPTFDRSDAKVLDDIRRHVPIAERYASKDLVDPLTPLKAESRDPNACQPAT